MNWTDTQERRAFAVQHASLASLAVMETHGLTARPSIQAAVAAALKTDSPIEAIFAAWFVAARDHLLSEGFARFAIDARPQAWIEGDAWNYRLDFSLEADAAPLLVGVELDGHDYHERSQAQVTARNQRDRDLTAAGWRILHFSGSEISRNPMVVVVEALVAGAEAIEVSKADLQASR